MNAIVILSVIVLIFALGGFAYAIIKHKNKNIKKNKSINKIKIKSKSEKTLKNKNGKLETKGSYCDVVDKYLFRKEVKLFVLINKILPPGYIAFPKVGVDKILEPIGSHALFNSIKGEYVDLVIFEQETMKPRIVIDIYDGSIGDEQLDVETPQVIEALKSAELPIVSVKVKSDYDIEEIKTPIFKILFPEEAKESDKNIE